MINCHHRATTSSRIRDRFGAKNLKKSAINRYGSPINRHNVTLRSVRSVADLFGRQVLPFSYFCTKTVGMGLLIMPGDSVVK